MSYRKQISYLELRENGQRIQSAGYAKLESMENEDILTVQLTGQNFSQGRTMPLYLNRESGEELLCEMTAEWGRASCAKRIPGKEDRKPILGIRILLGQDLVVVGSFAGADRDDGRGNGGSSDSSGSRRTQGQQRFRSEPECIERAAGEESRCRTLSAYEGYQMGAVKQYLSPYPSFP